jgi:hypothetical protein
MGKYFYRCWWPYTTYTWLGLKQNERSPKKCKEKKTSETINNTIPIVNFFVLEQYDEEKRSLHDYITPPYYYMLTTKINPFLIILTSNKKMEETCAPNVKYNKENEIKRARERIN